MKALSLDTEATGLDIRHGARPFLVTMCKERERPVFWEWDVDPTTRMPRIPIEDLVEIQEEIDKADVLVLQNSKFDWHGLKSLYEDYGMELQWDWAKVRDTLLSGHLLASNQPHDLTSMVLIYLGINIKPFEDAVEEAASEARRIARTKCPDWRIADKELPEMPSANSGRLVKYDMWLIRRIAEEVGYPEDHPWYRVCSDYANSDSESTLYLWKKHEQLLKSRGLMEIYQERLKILPVICSVERVGIGYHPDKSKELQKQYRDESEKAAEECIKIAKGFDWELELPKSGKNKSLTTFVFDKLKLPVVSTGEASGKPSLDKSAMSHYAATLPEGSVEHSFICWMLYKRRRDTSASYLEGYDRYALGGSLSGGKALYSSINPTGSGTLRMSSNHPNEQNIGKQEDDGSFAGNGMKSLRHCFGPAPGREWYSIDYENLELKIPAYRACEQVMIDVFEKPDEPPFFGSYHLLNASIVYPDLFWPLSEKKGEFKKKYLATNYQWIKNFGFAIQYGAQEATSDRAAHKEGAYRAVKAELRNIERLNQACIYHANKYGYVETIPDKEVNPKRGYPLMCRRSAWGKISPTLPLNYMVQGTACWIMMRAMIKVQEYIDSLNSAELEKNHIHVIINVHDELVFDFPKRHPKINLPKVRKIRDIMASLGDCVDVPLSCGVTFHPENWSEGVSI